MNADRTISPSPINVNNTRIVFRRSWAGVVLGIYVVLFTSFVSSSIVFTGSVAWVIDERGLANPLYERLLAAAFLLLFCVPFWFCAHMCLRDVAISRKCVSITGPFGFQRMLFDQHPVRIIHISDTPFVWWWRLLHQHAAVPIALRYGNYFVPLNFCHVATEPTVPSSQLSAQIHELLVERHEDTMR